jgi:uncharacterized membrane protein
MANKVKISLNRAMVALVSLFLCAVFPVKTLAIAQSVDPITINNAIGGQTYQSLLYIFNTDAEKRKIDIKATGEIAEWASFYSLNDEKTAINSLEVDGKKYGYAMARFAIPAGKANGVYTGQVIVSAGAGNSGGENQASVTQEMPREVSIRVSGEQFIDGEADIQLNALSLKAGEPLQITVAFTNKSNVGLKPQTELKVSKEGANGNVVDIIYPYTESSEVKPGEVKRIHYSWDQPAGLVLGSYKVEIRSYAENKDFGFTKFNLTIKPGDNMSGLTADLSKNFFGLQINTQSILGALAIFVLIVALGINLLKRRLKKNNATT